MTHLLRAVPDSILVRGYVTTGQNFRDIDQKTFVSINGDEGGGWSPSASINIGGAGMVVAGPWTFSDINVNIAASSAGPLTFDKGDATDYFGLPGGHPSETFSYFIDLLEVIYHPQGTGFTTNTDGILTFVSSAWNNQGIFSTIPGIRFAFPLRVLSGAPKIDTVTMSFIVFSAHASIPTMPRMRVIAVDLDGTVIPQHTPDATTDIDGFQNFPTPVSGAAWVAGGAIKNYTYTCDVVQKVDTSRYEYFVEMIDESGANSYGGGGGNRWLGLTVAFAGVSIFDGRS